MKMTFLAAEGCLASGIAGLVDMFAIANMWSAYLSGKPDPPFATEIVSQGGRPVVGSGCMQMLPTRSLADAPATDFVLIPPFIPLPVPDQGDSATVRNWIIAHHRRGDLGAEPHQRQRQITADRRHWRQPGGRLLPG